jgi:nucleotide-binding universal stress UspA family protein
MRREWGLLSVKRPVNSKEGRSRMAARGTGYSTVLVGTDGSASSYIAVERAAQVAAGSGARLVIACAYHPMTRRDEERAAEQLGHDAYKVHGSNPADSVLNEAHERARAAGCEDVELKPVDGDPVDVLLKLAAEVEANLIVVGNRGLNSLAGRLLGSVPANISHRATCDVLIAYTVGR